MKTVCIVQARTGSQRYPLKIFAGLMGKPMITHVLERAAQIKGVDQVVLAMPEADVKMSAHLWPYVFGGSEKDVLHRYAKCAEQYEADVVLRLTGDCPLIAPDLISLALGCMNERIDYLAMCQPYMAVADGWDAEIFQRRCLVNADRYAKKDEREHVTTWLRNAGQPVICAHLYDWTALKCSVDTREDLRRVETIMQHLEDQRHVNHDQTWKAWEKAGRP